MFVSMFNCLEKKRRQNNCGGQEKPQVAVTLSLAREEVVLAHYEHLDGEEKEREGVDVEQRVAVAYLEQVGQLEKL